MSEHYSSTCTACNGTGTSLPSPASPTSHSPPCPLPPRPSPLPLICRSAARSTSPPAAPPVPTQPRDNRAGSISPRERLLSTWDRASSTTSRERRPAWRGATSRGSGRSGSRRAAPATTNAERAATAVARAEGRDYTLERRARATSSANHAPHQRRERRLEAQRAAAASTAAAAAAAAAVAAAASLRGGGGAAADCKHQQPAARHAAAWGRVGSAARHLAARHAPDLSCAAAPPLPRAAPSPPPRRPPAVSAALLGRTRPCRPQLLCRQRRRRHGPSRRCRRSHARRPRCRRSSMADTATTTAPGR